MIEKCRVAKPGCKKGGVSLLRDKGVIKCSEVEGGLKALGFKCPKRKNWALLNTLADTHLHGNDKTPSINRQSGPI